MKRTIPALAAKLILINRPFQIRVNDRDIRIGPNCQGSLFELGDLGSRDGHQFDQSFPADVAWSHQRFDIQRKRTLEPKDAERRVGKFQFFFFRQMRGVIRCQAIQCAINHPAAVRSGGFIL